MEKKCNNKEGDLNCAHSFPMVLGYKRGSGIMKVAILEVRVYPCEGVKGAKYLKDYESTSF